MKKIFTLFLCLFSMYLAMAQDSLSLKGIVRDNDKALAAVTVSLLKAADSSLVKIALTDAAGHYEFQGVPAGVYRIMASFVGYGNQYSDPVSLQSSKELPVITLQPEAKSLTGVTVQAKRPLVEAKLDKMVVNVDASPSNAASNVLEVLEKSPGISVDRDGNISLKGKQGVMVYIDGKQTYLGGEDLANLLKSMPANQLDQIEIMTQPSAKFDAAGNSGIINLRTKKSKTMGMNGSITTSFVQGNYPKSPNSFSFNYRKGKVNFFSSGGYTFWQGDNSQILNRKFHKAGTTSVFAQDGWQKNTNNNFNLRVGMDYAVNAKTSLGFTVNGVSNRNKGMNTSNGDFYKLGSNVIDSSITADNFTRRTWKSLSTNVNFRRQLNANGRELTADLDYIQYKLETESVYRQQGALLQCSHDTISLTRYPAYRYQDLYRKSGLCASLWEMTPSLKQVLKQAW
jgi:hypothetical protein